MARKTASQAAPERPVSDLGQAVIDSAQKIWLAGLGAFSRARSEGDRMFEVLVEQGKGLRERARGAADEALSNVRTQTDSTVGQARGQWDKLEQVFEDRVARSLKRLGVVTTEEIDELSRQVQELNSSVRAMMDAGRPRAAAGKARGAARPRKKAARKASR